VQPGIESPTKVEEASVRVQTETRSLTI